MSRRTSLPAVLPQPASASVVDVLTGAAPLVPALPDGPVTRAAAAALTEAIRHTAREIGDRLARLRQLVEQAREHEVWAVLGYASWTAYLVDVLEPVRLPRDERREVVGYLTGQGLSSRAIAPIVGADQKTVVNDRRALELVGPVSAGEESSSPALIVGLDGKSYTAPAAERPRLVVVPALGAHEAEERASDVVTRRAVGQPAPGAAGAFVAALADEMNRSGVITREAWEVALAVASAAPALPLS